MPDTGEPKPSNPSVIKSKALPSDSNITGSVVSQIAQPSTFLRLPILNRTTQETYQKVNAVDSEQLGGLLVLREGFNVVWRIKSVRACARLTTLALQNAIREFLKIRTSYDVLPLSFRLIILDTDLLVKKSLTILLQNGIVSAPLWDSHTSTFAGLLTTSDYINVVQYYWQYPDALNQIDQFRLSSLRDIEKAIGVSPLETVSVHPTRALYEACRQMLKTRARRIPLVDLDDETGRQMVVSVITQYRLLKFIAVNVTETEMLKKSVSEIGLGTYKDLQTATMDTPVMDVIHIMVKYSISSVPILDENGRVLNVFEAVDVIAIIKGGAYDELTTIVGEALSKRANDFAGIYTCSEEDRLNSIFDTIRKSRVHRLIVIDDENCLKGIISLSDILKYVLLHGEIND
ncbi:nuclear protein SNF4 [Blumeria hordei DH14]|uniref:Nuclear protein SNF4 n=1 Tax=Blumeria graminis f. sp. hordei (strain DH14) TaxID=546991 RepID=N1J651_BLUG1|nr:nuclear protein SNF4 [Blumeria hordei DH14]